MRQYLQPLLLCALLAPLPAAAQGRYQTPEYSGPSAKFDDTFDRYRAGQRDSRNLQQQMLQQQRAKLNDVAPDRMTRSRNQTIQEGLVRRETELRRQTMNE